MVRTDNFIRTRKLADHEIVRINHVLKARARRYIAAGKEDWLFPEQVVDTSWEGLRQTLLPPERELFGFGGETYAKFEDGRVHYQDAYGRTEKEREYLKKELPTQEPRVGDACGCGSGAPYKVCCMGRPETLRPSWSERSIRERNMLLHRAIVTVLGLDEDKDWDAIRRDLTDDQIKEVYFLYETLWPRETDLLALLPKPDGRPRAVYTGSLHPQSIVEFAIGAPLYFGELIVQHPFPNAGAMAKKYSPVENPRSFHQEFLKDVLFFLTVAPLVDAGLINLIPDPCDFDSHLRDQMWHMANERWEGLKFDPADDPRLKQLLDADRERDLLLWPRDAQIRRAKKLFPDIAESEIEAILRVVERRRLSDPLAALQDNLFEGGKEGGQMRLMKMAPNFEMAMYLAQATGAAIVTDSAFRWQEILRASRRRSNAPKARLQAVATHIANASYVFPVETNEIIDLARRGTLSSHPSMFGDIFRYLAGGAARPARPNWEASIAARMGKDHATAQRALRKANTLAHVGRISSIFPPSGIQDHTINRLLLMSSSERHLPSVPMAFYIQRPEASQPRILA